MTAYFPGCPRRATPDNPPPAEPGEFRLIDSTGSVIFVGTTHNLRQRYNQYITDPDHRRHRMPGEQWLYHAAVHAYCDDETQPSRSAAMSGRR